MKIQLSAQQRLSAAKVDHATEAAKAMQAIAKVLGDPKRTNKEAVQKNLTRWEEVHWKLNDLSATLSLTPSGKLQFVVLYPGASVGFNADKADKLLAKINSEFTKLDDHAEVVLEDALRQVEIANTTRSFTSKLRNIK